MKWELGNFQLQELETTETHFHFQLKESPTQHIPILTRAAAHPLGDTILKHYLQDHFISRSKLSLHDMPKTPTCIVIRAREMFNPSFDFRGPPYHRIAAALLKYAH